MNKLIEESLQKRYATKMFDSTKKINQKDIDTLIESIRLAPSSYGLQLMKLVIVENVEIRKELLKHSYHQNQIVDASHLFILCTEREFLQEHIEEYVENISKIRNIDKNDLSGYKSLLEKTKDSYSYSEAKNWMEKQVYIALGNLLTTCALLSIDACPIEGFENLKYDEILGLNNEGLHSIIVVPVGKSHELDKYKTLKKVRRPKKDFVIVK